MAKQKILFVDDDPSLVQVVSLALTLQGYEVSTANGGAEALLRLQESDPPDLILSDVMMPGIDGVELCRRVRADPKFAAIPIFIFTALSAAEDVKRIREAGATKMITKPFDIVELANVIRAYLSPA